MTEPKTFSYTTHLDIKFDPLALIDVDQLAKSVTDQWYNQTLCRVNDSVVRLGVMHCTRAPEKSVILMVETAAIVPTGDA